MVVGKKVKKVVGKAKTVKATKSSKRAKLIDDEAEEDDDEEEEDDDEGWITPSNLKKHQEKDGFASSSQQQPAQRFLQVALLTSDFAMQNVLLQMGLSLVGVEGKRIERVKTWVLRCHACFK